MGGKIVGSAFAAFIKPLIQHGRVPSKYFGKRHSWPSHLQADLPAACRRGTNLGMWGGLQPWQIHCQSSQACYFPWQCSSEFLQVFYTSSGTERPSLVKLRTDWWKHGKGTCWWLRLTFHEDQPSLVNLKLPEYRMGHTVCYFPFFYSVCIIMGSSALWTW